MCEKGVVQFLSSEEVFESFGNEFLPKDIIENGNSDIEKVANMGQFLLKRFVAHNEELNTLQGEFVGYVHELVHLKERQKYLDTVEVTYQTATQEMELELESMKKVHSNYQKEVKRLQREVIRSNETETSLRKSISEAASTRKSCTFQPDTFKHFPARDYCLLCLNSSDHSSYHEKQTDALFQQLIIARNVCNNMEQELQAENEEKELLTDKLISLRKEAEALMKCLQLSGRGHLIVRPGMPEKLSEVTHCNNCDNIIDKNVTKIQEHQGDEIYLKLTPDKDTKTSEPPVLPTGDICHTVNRTVPNLQENQSGKLDKETNQYETLAMSEIAVPKTNDVNHYDSINGLYERVQGQYCRQQNGPTVKPEEQKSEAVMKTNQANHEKEQQVCLTFKGNEHPIYSDDRDMHCSSCIVNGQCQACSAFCVNNFGCFRELFYCLITYLNTLIHKK